MQLLGCRVDQFFVSEAEGQRPEAGQPVDIALSLVIVEIDALAMIQNHRAKFAVPRQMGKRMQQRLDVTSRHVAQRRHVTSTMRSSEIVPTIQADVPRLPRK